MWITWIALDVIYGSFLRSKAGLHMNDRFCYYYCYPIVTCSRVLWKWLHLVWFTGAILITWIFERYYNYIVSVVCTQSIGIQTLYVTKRQLWRWPDVTGYLLCRAMLCTKELINVHRKLDNLIYFHIQQLSLDYCIVDNLTFWIFHVFYSCIVNMYVRVALFFHS